MNSIIRISGADYKGCTITQMLERVTSDLSNNDLKNKPLIVIKNGKLITTSDYGKETIAENDDIKVMELTVGG